MTTTSRSRRLLLFLLLISPLISVHAIPFSTVFRKTTTLLLKRPLFGMHHHDERIPSFLRKSPSTSITETVHSLLGGFASDSFRARRKFSLSSALYEETISKTKPSDTLPVDKTESAHLKLGSTSMLPSYLQHERKTDKDNKHDNEDNHTEKKKDGNVTQSSLLHTYTDSRHNISFSGFHVSKRKFSAFINHTLATNPIYMGCTFDSSFISTRNIVVDSMDTRHELRALWRSRRLLTDRTEVLAIYKSDDDDKTNDKNQKRGGFSDLLHIYANRLSAILQDENDEINMTTSSNNSTSLVEWLQREYGMEETKELRFENIKHKSTQQQYQTLQHFLEFFRLKFPYYYDRCDSCGASAKDDDAVVCIQDNDNTSTKEDQEDEDDEGTFLGYIYPTDEELRGKASRTEIYQCHKCGCFTRFPRYNAASFVIHHERGRCGEYSMLLYRILRATGHTCRWIVDWADHVWAEVLLHGKWIHLDPCEAAVDKPLLYEEWGKQQTYIVAFHGDNGTSIPLIEDVTLRYTSCNADELQKRRNESHEELQVVVDKAIVELEEKLAHRMLNK